MVIAIEGLPGAGKTTTAGLVAQRLAARAVMETTAEHPFLNQVYDDGDRDDLTVELTFLIVHANPYRRLDRSLVTVCDFSPAKDKLFAEDMLRGDDLELFMETYSRIYRGHRSPDVAVFLRVDPQLCLERVRQRMRIDSRRAYEAGLTLERLRRMETRYEEGLDRLGRETLVCNVPPDLSQNGVAGSVVDTLKGRVPALATR
jgi:deoxyadenosine/deoxycytidine kinase